MALLREAQFGEVLVEQVRAQLEDGSRDGRRAALAKAAGVVTEDDIQMSVGQFSPSWRTGTACRPTAVRGREVG